MKAYDTAVIENIHEILKNKLNFADNYEITVKKKAVNKYKHTPTDTGK